MSVLECECILIKFEGLVNLLISFCLQKMQEQLTKQSPSLERDAVYTKTVSILPGGCVV